MTSMRGDPIPAEGQGISGDPLAKCFKPARIRRRRIERPAWESHRDRITQLYSVEKKSLIDIQSIMESEHNFYAT
jgi:Clr5-like protein